MSQQRLSWISGNGEMVTITLDAYNESLVTGLKDLRNGLEALGMEPLLTERQEIWSSVKDRT